jgi:hypothetical protein
VFYVSDSLLCLASSLIFNFFLFLSLIFVVSSFLTLVSFFSSFLSVDEEPVEGALSQALPMFVQMGFIVPDVTKTLEEEQKEEALKMGKS